jgi:hypothetical protein
LEEDDISNLSPIPSEIAEERLPSPPRLRSMRRLQYDEELEELRPIAFVDSDLRQRGLNTTGTEEQRRQRLERVLRDNRPFITITGQTYDLEDRLSRPGTAIGRNNRVMILGEGAGILDRQPNDPKIRLILIPDPVEPYQNIRIPEDFDPERDCLGMYSPDPITFNELSDIDPSDLYVDDQKRCFVISSILEKWERGFSSFDHISTRIVPQYPLNFDNNPVDPAIVRAIWQLATNKEQYPLLRTLIEWGTDGSSYPALENIYQFITTYDILTDEFDKVNDAGAPNRRDMLAQNWIETIFKVLNCGSGGGRKFLSIVSERGRNGTQIYYQCVLTAMFRLAGFRIRFDENDMNATIHWEYDPSGDDDTDGPINPARSCVSDIAI